MDLHFKNIKRNFFFIYIYMGIKDILCLSVLDKSLGILSFPLLRSYFDSIGEYKQVRRYPDLRRDAIQA